MVDRVDDVLILPDGRALGYRVRGVPDGHPILYCHGQPGSRMEIELFSDEAIERVGVRIAAYDRPGMGRSSYHPAQDMQLDVRDGIALLDHLGIEQAAVIGTSAGGAPAMAVAATHPDRIIRVVLAAATGPYDDETHMHDEDIEAHRDLRERGVEAFEAEYEEDAAALIADVRGTIARWFGSFPDAERRWAIDGAGAAGLEGDLREAVRQGGRGWLRETEVRSRPWTFDVAAIRVPVIAFHGTADSLEKLSNLQRVLARVPDATLHVIEGGDHLAPLLDPVPLLEAAVGR
jgi:pimeloyl-ACP methyl ester carboxylesterase